MLNAPTASNTFVLRTTSNRSNYLRSITEASAMMIRANLRNSSAYWEHGLNLRYGSYYHRWNYHYCRLRCPIDCEVSSHPDREVLQWQSLLSCLPVKPFVWPYRKGGWACISFRFQLFLVKEIVFHLLLSYQSTFFVPLFQGAQYFSTSSNTFFCSLFSCWYIARI